MSVESEIVYGSTMSAMSPGRKIEIRGNTTLHSVRITINLQRDKTTNNIPLDLSVRFPDGYIVRNTLINGSWGTEETSGGMPVVKGGDFNIAIVCLFDMFQIYVDGKHFCDYEHRLPFHLVNYLEIKGGVKINNVTIS